jgi:Flp pilus assembly pilin Flp
MRMVTRKGQTALEYLLIAVVALVVVAVVYNYAQTSSETAQEQGTGITTAVFERMNEDVGASACTSSGERLYSIVDFGSVVDYSSDYQYPTNYGPEKAIDSSINTFWVSYYGPSEREENIKIDLGSSTCVDAVRARVYKMNDGDTIDLTLKVDGTVVATQSFSSGWQFEYIVASFPESRNIREIELIAEIPSSGNSNYIVVSNFDIQL